MLYDHRRAEVYLRSDVIGHDAAQQRVLDRIERLDERGVFDVAELESTWQGVEIAATDDRPEALRTYEEFADWAAANEFSLAPAFERRERYVEGTTERREAVVFPVVALAIYVGDQLRAVLPSSDEFSHYTVHEAIEGFERGDLDRWLSRFRGITVERTAPRVETTTDVRTVGNAPG
jgi:hypothetical protein